MAGHEKPWWLDLTKEIGGLGIVLVMLVGLYFLARDYGDTQKQAWIDIREIIAKDLQADRLVLENTGRTIAEFMAAHDTRMTELEKRVRTLENDRAD